LAVGYLTVALSMLGCATTIPCQRDARHIHGGRRPVRASKARTGRSRDEV